MLSDSDELEYESNLEPKRYRIAFIFSFAQITTALIYPVLNPINTSITKIYDIKTSVVTLAAMLYLLMHPISSVPVNNILQKKGLRVGVALGGIFLIIGTLLRCLINYGFGWVYAGMIIAGIGRPFIMNSQGKVPLQWFEASKRLQITTILSFCNTVFAIIGFLIPGFVFQGYELENDSLNDYKDGKRRAESLMLIEAIITAVCMLTNIIFMEAKPQNYPSHAAKLADQEKINNQGQTKNMTGELFQKRSYVFLFICFGVFFGSFIALGVGISSMTEPFHFQDKDISNAILGAVPGLSGIFGSAIMTGYVKRTQKYKRCLYFSMIGTAVNILMFPVYLQIGYAMAIIGSLMNGFFLIPVIPIMLDFACELVYPIGDSHAMGILIAGGQLWGFVMGFIITAIVGNEPTQGTVWAGAIFIVVMNIIGIVLCSQIKEDLRRTRAEEERRTLSTISVSDIGDLAQDTRAISMQEPLMDYDDKSTDDSKSINSNK